MSIPKSRGARLLGCLGLLRRDDLPPEPGPGGMTVIGSSIWDPDGYFVELNPLLRD